MKLALILTPYKDRAYDTISIPLGLAWLNSYIKSKIRGLEIYNYDLLLEPELEEQLYKQIELFDYDIIGIQAHSNATYREADRIAANCKRINPHIIVILGGNAATFMANHFLATGNVDFIVYGEGEISFTNLLNAIINRSSYSQLSSVKGISFIDDSKRIHTTMPQPLITNLDEIPLPDRDSFSWEKYPQWSIITSRGCPYSCAFCSSSEFWQHKVRFRSAANVYYEIEQLKFKYKVNRLYILDDTFGANHDVTVNLLEDICKNKLDLQWACLTRAEIATDAMLVLFKRAGCVQIHFGLESANLHTQKYLKKNLDIKALRHAVQFCHSIGIKTKLSVIFGLPNETEDHLRETINFLLDLQPNEVQIYPLMPYIGIEILNDSSLNLLNEGNHEWKQDALIPLSQSTSLSSDQQIKITLDAVGAFRDLGYKWIPMDVNPEKHNINRIIKTVFAPIQGLEKV